MLIGEKVRLRPITAADLSLLEAWANDPAINSEYNTFALRPSGQISRAFAESGFLSDARGELIVSTQTDETAGHVSYRGLGVHPS